MIDSSQSLGGYGMKGVKTESKETLKFKAKTITQYRYPSKLDGITTSNRGKEAPGA